MVRATGHTARKKAAETEFPYHAVSRRLGAIEEDAGLVGAHVAPGAWDMYRHSERRKGARSLEYARLYFTTETDAETFLLRRRRVR